MIMKYKKKLYFSKKIWKPIDIKGLKLFYVDENAYFVDINSGVKSNVCKIPNFITLLQDEHWLYVKPNYDVLYTLHRIWWYVKSMFGTIYSNLTNHIIGLWSGFIKEVWFSGLGYKITNNATTKRLKLKIGFSVFKFFDYRSFKGTVSLNHNNIIFKGIDKQHVHLFAAQLRSMKKVNRYTGMGAWYSNEVFYKKKYTKKDKVSSE